MAEPFSGDGDAVVEAAGEVFGELLETLPYVENPEHPMADSVFTCAGAIAVYLALSRAGARVDVHRFGCRMLDVLVDTDPAGPAPTYEEMHDAGESSQQHSAPNEFVFRVLPGDGGDVRRGIDITSCAICHLCAAHDAMDLVPYMCALDAVVSDRYHQGLRRTGSIALGAAHCDFRFTGRSGERLRLADQYPRPHPRGEPAQRLVS